MKKNLKEVLNATWKVAVCLVGLLALVIIVRYARTEYYYHFGRAYCDDMTLSSDVVVRAYMNSTCRVYNKRTGHYTTRKLRWVSGTPERDSLTVFCDKNGYRGFLNVNTGEIVIPAQYGKAWHFSEGLAAVEYGKKQLGFINYDNELVISAVPHESGYHDYLFKDGFCVVQRWDGVMGEWIHTVLSSKTLGVIAEYYTLYWIDDHEYMIARDDDGYWLLDKEFNRVFAEPYDKIEQANDVDGVFVVRNWVKQLIGFDGTVIEPFVIDGTCRLSYVSGLTDSYYDSDRECYDQDEVTEFEPDLVVYKVNYNSGLMNAHTGKIITPAMYGDITMISRDLIRAEVNRFTYESVLLDRNGNRVDE